ncbi:TSUP family transporter [Thauera sinica]|uniref:Probable membrane transporter protein n=1 Tax=Thauera sinica TaxID=2665146 RepID=A0ABW1ALH8_9RHOO
MDFFQIVLIGIAAFAAGAVNPVAGGGLGIPLIAAPAMQGVEDVHEINALKNRLSAVIYSVTVGTFVVASAVSWPHAPIMLATATLGGYVGATLARRIPPVWLRRCIIAVGRPLTAPC